MEVLLDTHILIWFINGDDALSEKSKKIISNIDNKCHISIASIWEIAIKLSLGKLSLNGGLTKISKILKKYEIEILPIEFSHIEKLLKLEFYHKDPFDRIIISQSLVEKIPIITIDEKFKEYNVDVIL